MLYQNEIDIIKESILNEDAPDTIKQDAIESYLEEYCGSELSDEDFANAQDCVESGIKEAKRQIEANEGVEVCPNTGEKFFLPFLFEMHANSLT